MFKFLHTADIHLDSPLQKLERYEGAPVEALRQATRRALENLVELAVAEQVAFVLIAGDLYDGDWKDYNTGLYFVSQMRKLREAGVAVYIIAGNHDAENRITKTLRLPEGVHFFPTDGPDTVHLVDPDVAIHGQGFAAPSVRKDLSAGYPLADPGYFNIGMLHTCATGREGHEPYAPCKMEGLLSKGYDYWALGHVHQREILHEDPLIVFPGNIQGRHARETGPKGCMLVTVGDSGRAEADFRPLHMIQWEKIEIDATDAETGYDILDIVSNRIEELLKNNADLPLIVRVEVLGKTRSHLELTADFEHWISEIRSAGIDSGNGRVWIEKVKFHTFPHPENKTDRFADGPVGELLHYLDELQTDPVLLKKIGEPLNDLMSKLPRELRHGSDALCPDDPEWLSELLHQVRPMLLRCLMPGGDAR
ncbi:MAG TPA: DNA repair exonuclease [Desulfobacterales bacterium]|nr:DNA repair exonuclease [Desulfobacterales bacterium]